MTEHQINLAYIGPETMLPLASIIGAIIGVLLMIWQRIVSFVSGAYARLLGKSASPSWMSRER
jgi:hypothetical protein